MGHRSYGITTDSLDDSNLFADSNEHTMIPVTTASDISATYTKGTIMGVVTVTGKWSPYSAGNADGTEVARGIAAEAGEADYKTSVYVSGTFNEDALTGFDATAKTHLRDRGIFTKEVY